MNKTTLLALALAAPFCGVAMGTPIVEGQPATQAVENMQVATPAVKNPALAATDPTLASADTPAEAAAVPATGVPENYTVEQNPVKQHGVFFDVNVGTMGVGLDVGYQITPYIKARVRAGALKFKYSDSLDSFTDRFEDFGFGSLDADLDFEFSNKNFGVMLDYHPFAGHFHLTAGVNYADLYVDLQASLRDGGKYEIGNDVYYVNGGSGMVGGKLTWDKFQPYIGLGWSSDPTGKFDVFFSCELGVNFMGKGKISTRASNNVMVEKGGVSVPIPVDSEMLDQSLRDEASWVYDVADALIVYPVIQIGIGCRF